VPAHGREVEPFVRLDQIDRDARAGGIGHAERKAAVRIFRLDRTGRRNFDSHFGLPIIATAPPLRTTA
jgi:hypothetical protein